ncbi:MAG: ABC1 family-domain-containing protein [Benniella sp.]|nr:MAG: ABC1 family-domain-containing protein [Benniella sp.]
MRLQQYLEDMLEDYVLHPILTIWRFGVLALIFLPLIITAPAVFMGKRIPELHDERSGTIWWYRLLVRHMEMAGPTFIKLSQWAASRSDIFPKQLCTMLSKLHNQVDPHSIRHTRRTIEAAFGGRKLEDIFDEFIETPLGIGAIAQVYRGRLKPGIALHFEPDEQTEDASKESVLGKLTSVAKVTKTPPSERKEKRLKTEVAIKVLHPKVARTVERDLAIMRFFAQLIHRIPGMRWISLPDQVAMFGEMMREQLDLRIEARNLETFQRNFRDRYTVTFPTPLIQFATKEMLIEEFVDALPLKTYLQNGAGPFDLKIADIGLDGFLRMLIFDNFVHADLHPGNIFVRFYNPSANNFFKQIIARIRGGAHESMSHVDEATMRLRAVPKGDKEAWEQELEDLYNEGFRPQVVFIDAGLVSELSDKNRRDFLDLFHALAEFDGYRAGELMIERCRSPQSVLDGERFALRMQKLIMSVKSTAMSLGKIKIAELLSEVMHMVRTHHVPMEGDFANVVISILILEGIGRQLNPNIDLFKTALPILRQLGRQDGGRGVVEGVRDLPGGGGWWIKMWFLLEARQWAHETIESTTTVDRHLDVLLHPAI